MKLVVEKTDGTAKLGCVFSSDFYVGWESFKYSKQLLTWSKSVRNFL
jgi:hypothetical protein